jgi:stearoyl-CoA desaturase (Delta-9 desaturase)
MPTRLTADEYDGRTPFAVSGRPPGTVQGRARVGVTTAFVVVPFAGLAAAVWLAWGHGLNLADVLLALAFYVITGLGVTVGFHRLLTHRSFTAVPALRVALAIAGSMSFEGEVIGWVAIHRRHHAFSDRPGDPHSPYRYGSSVAGQLRGLAHAHAGWLLRDDPTPPARYAPDMVADPAMRAVSAAFPALCAVSLALPFAAGWLICGTWRAALAALLWAGLVRVAPVCHPPLRPRHQPVASCPALVRRELAQHAPFRSFLRTARRGPRPGRHLCRRDPRLRAPRLGHQGALAYARPP